MKILQNQKFIFVVYVIAALAIAFQQYYLLANYNNFTIFQHSSFHFFNHINPYLKQPREHFDIFLYNPSFTILFVPFAYLPSGVGLFSWCIFSFLIFFFSVRSFPLHEKSKIFMLYLIIPELATSVMNLETNVTIAAFILFTFSYIEKEKFFSAAAFPNLSFFIKGYGAISGIFFFLKKPSVKTFLFLGTWFLIIGGLPLIFYSPSQFKIIYLQWFQQMQEIYSYYVGLSIMGLIKALVYKNVSILFIQLCGVFLFVITFLSVLIKKNYEHVKYLFLAYVMIWVIIFNHSSESPTYIIASSGVFIWFLQSGKTILNSSLFVFFVILTMLSPTDLFPSYVRQHFFVPYCLKALPCTLIWIKLQVELLISKSNHV